MILTIAMELRDARIALKKLQDSSTTRWAHPAPPPRVAWAPPSPHLQRDWAPPAHIRTGTGLPPCHICTGTGCALLPASAPGLGSPLHICAGTGAHPFHICTGTGLPPAHLRRDWGPPLPHLHRNRARSCPVPDASCHAHRRPAPHACMPHGVARMRAGTLCSAAAAIGLRGAQVRELRGAAARVARHAGWRCNAQQTTRLQHATRTRQRGCNTQHATERGCNKPMRRWCASRAPIGGALPLRRRESSSSRR